MWRLNTKKSGALLCFGTALLFAGAGRLEGALIDCTTVPQTYNTTLASGSDDGIVGFAWLQAGLTIATDTTFSVALAVPVSGAITLTDSTSVLTMASDVWLASGASITGTGSIDGGSSPSYTIHLGDDLTYTGTSDVLTLPNSMTIDGHNHTLAIAGGNSIAVAASATLTLRNMTLRLPTSATAFSLNASSTLVLENVRVYWGTSYTASAGSITIKGNTVFSGMPGDTLTYSSSGNFTIATKSSLLLDFGIKFKHNYGSADNFIFTDRTSRLLMIGSTFESAARNLLLTTGTIIADHYSIIKGTPATTASVTFGSSSEGLELFLILMPAATIKMIPLASHDFNYNNPT